MTSRLLGRWEFPTRALMFLHHFPPQENIAAFRFGRLLGHLPELGVDPVVISSACERRGPGAEFEEMFGIQIPVTRVQSWDPIAAYQRRGAEGGDTSSAGRVSSWRQRLKKWVRSCLVPDDKFAYVSSWTNAARPLVDGVDVIYSSSSPYSAHLAARRLARETQIPWVMEMRDLWADSPYLPARRNPIALSFHRRWERRCLTEASQIVVLSPAHGRHLAKEYPEFADKIHVVTNMMDRASTRVVDGRRVGAGLDPSRDTRISRPTASLSSSERPSSSERLSLSERGGSAKLSSLVEIRLAYVGSLYGGRSLKSLVDAIDRRNATDTNVRWRLEVAGTSMDLPWDEVLGHSDAVTRHGQLSPSQVVELLHSVQIGVVHNPGWDEIHIPGKLFDYLGARLSILNLSSQPDIEEMVRDCVPVASAHPDRVDEIEQALLQLLKDERAGYADSAERRETRVEQNPGDALARFSSVAVAVQLVDVFRSAAKSGSERSGSPQSRAERD